MLPKKAKKVFKGNIFEIYQWPQKMFDGTIKTFEMAKSMDGVGVIATVGKKIVLLKQKQPGTKWYYTLPGGYLDDPKETARQGALRELREETGMIPEHIKYWKSFERGGRVISYVFMYIARNCQIICNQQLDGGEKIEIEYRTFEEFLELSDNPKFHHPRMMMEMLKARMSKENKAAFKKLIFG